MMDTFVNELKKLFSLKDTTTVGDIVILASVEPKMLLYALVTSVNPDPGRKKSWWNVTMQVLTIPPREIVWTLREPQFTGQEIFTFDGVEHFMKAVRFDTAPSSMPSFKKDTDELIESGESKRGLRVIK